MEVTGKIRVLGDTKEVGSNGFRKRELVVTTDEQYPQHILIEFVQDKCSLLDNYQVGQDVRVSINLRGRDWTSPQGEVKYFNTITGWRIEALQPAANATPPEMPPLPESFEKAGSATDFNPEENDDLPF
jgi:hypothetical protein